MKKILTMIGLIVSFNTNAACFGGDAFQQCSDSSGNNYVINRYGNTTEITGSNQNTGSRWNETVQTYGNTTEIRGNSNGRSWNETITPFGVYGTDSHGNYFNHRR